MSGNNYNIKSMETINFIPTECINCKHAKLSKDIVKASIPNQSVSGTYHCPKCELLMVVKLPPKTMLEELKQTVSFIYDFEDEEQLKPIGTGFFIKIPVEHISNGYLRYFVTAKHIIQKENGDYLSKIVLRLNKKSGGIVNSLLELNPENLLTHNDPEVDIVAMPLTLLNVDYKSIPIEIVKEHTEIRELGFGEGDDVFFCGMFHQHMGETKNQPIFRFGKVSLMTDEKILWKDEGKMKIKTELYLVECFSTEGNSGSPVFFKVSPQHETMQTKESFKIYLAGVLKGTFQERKIVKSHKIEGVLDVNIGITAVTPSQKLKEILYSQKALDYRKRVQLANPSTEDTVKK